MKREIDTAKYLKTQHFILLRQLNEIPKIKYLKKEKILFDGLAKLIHFLRKTIPFTMQTEIKKHATSTHSIKRCPYLSWHGSQSI